MLKNVKLLLLGILFIACREPRSLGFFPETPVNLALTNSAWDDVNSDIFFVGHYVDLVFSTNRPNPTTDFKLTHYGLSFSWDQKENFLLLQRSLPHFPDPRTKALQDLTINSYSNSDEKGPYTYVDASNNLSLLFSRESDGIHSIHALTEKPIPSLNSRYLPFLRILDETSNEMYPCLYGKNYLKGEREGVDTPLKLLFSSDKEGNFNIYEIDIPVGKSPIEVLSSSGIKDAVKLNINSGSNDHMPYVMGDLLVFASDRPGGIGGYDLYYSKKTADSWSEPITFGGGINSEFDEYRPVVSSESRFINNLMIFSSNRTGGQGGFDLYYVGFPK